jgi:hypothetical protein
MIIDSKPDRGARVSLYAPLKEKGLPK